MKKRTKMFLLIGATVGILSIMYSKDYEKSDVHDETLAIYVEKEDGSFSLSTDKAFPKIGYILNTEKSKCSSGGELSQDGTTKTIAMSSSNSEVCQLYFDCERYSTTTLTNGLKVYDSNTNGYTFCNGKEMYAFDHEETEQTAGWSEEERRDYRFIGKNPQNYIEFNDELWRIVGVFTVENSEGIKERRIKIVRNEVVGRFERYKGSLHPIANKTTPYNDWGQSYSQLVLNGDYYNRTGDYKEVGLNDVARSQISEVKWYNGRISLENEASNGEKYYSLERGSLACTGDTCNKLTVEKSISNVVALVYPSDYIYTFAKNVNEVCFETPNTCGADSIVSSWMQTGINEGQQYMFSAISDNEYGVYIISQRGSVIGGYGAGNEFGIKPSVYLKADVILMSGDGSIDNPYKIG